LNVTAEVAGLARIGPVKNHADLVRGVVASPETAVHFVTLLEEMPVQETTDAVTELGALGLPVGALIVNQTRQPALTEEQLSAAGAGALDADQIAAGLDAVNLANHPQLVGALTREAEIHAERVALESRERADLTGLDLPTVELPWLADGIDLAGLYELADLLGEPDVRGVW
jgi:hypothetical protein